MEQRTSWTNRATYLTLWALLSAVPGAARAQWAVTGTTPGGGNVINGTGCTGALPAGSLSVGGFNQVTLQACGQASGCGPVQFSASNETLNNFGIICSTSNLGVGQAVRFCKSSSLSHETVNNFGTITGSPGTAGALFLGSSGSSVNDTRLFNSGTITAGICGVFNHGIEVRAAAGLTGFVLTNSGLISGGPSSCIAGDGVQLITGAGDLTCGSIANSGSIAGGPSSFQGGLGIRLRAVAGSVRNVQINNSGAIRGNCNRAQGLSVRAFADISAFTLQNSGSISGSGGSPGVSLETLSGSISAVSIKNSGTLLGGDSGCTGGAGLLIDSDRCLLHTCITNTGSITGGSAPGLGGDAIRVSSSGLVADLTINNSGIAAGASCAAQGGSGLTIRNTSNLMGSRHVTIVNSGCFLGGSGNTCGGGGVRIQGQCARLDSLTVHNTGRITGGGSGGGCAGAGLEVTMFGSGVTNTVITNSGSMTGGGLGPIGGSGICIFAQADVSTLSFNNSGTIAGADGGIGAGFGIEVRVCGGSLNNVMLTNSGLISGGVGPEGGGGVDFAASSVTGVEIANTGTIRGGGTHGLNVDAFCGNLDQVLLNNSGSIIGGHCSSAAYLGASNAVTNLAVANSGQMLGASAGGYGLWIDADNNNICTVSVLNSGSISGGNCWGHGVYSHAGGDILNAVLTNSGTATGGAAGGNGIFFEANQNINGLSVVNHGLITGGFCAGHGLSVSAGSLIQNMSIFNQGTIVGGPGGFACCVVCGPCGSSGNAVHITAANGVGLTLTNFGTLTGGDGNFCAAPGSGVNSTSGSLTVNNWGVIAAGTGCMGVAVELNTSSCNTVNLNGHSSTRGIIRADGFNNVLNLNFTGLSPAEIARITADLNAQGVLDGMDSTGSVVIRGETIQWDPLIVNFNGLSYQLQGGTPNQQAVGNSLDSLTSNPTPGSCTANLLNAIDLSGNVPQALAALSPQRFQIYGDIAKASANLRVTEVNRRLNDLRTGSASDTRNTTATAGGNPDAKGGFFTTGYGTFANLDGNADIADARFTSSGVLAGIDHRYSDHFVAGALLSFTSTQASLDGIGSGAHVQGFGGGAYAGYSRDGWFANALATYDSNNYSSNRRILFPGFDQVAVARTDGDLLIADLDVGHDTRLNDRWTAGPELGLQYIHLGVDGFSELGGAGTALTIGGQTVSAFRSRLGGRASYTAPFHNDRTFALELRAAWQHDFDDSNQLLASFAGGFVPFTVETTNLARDTVLGGVGANLTGKDATSYIRYDIQAGDSSSQQYASAGVRVRF